METEEKNFVFLPRLTKSEKQRMVPDGYGLVEFQPKKVEKNETSTQQTFEICFFEAPNRRARA